MSPQIRRVTRLSSFLQAENPSPMTLGGTNSWLLREPGAEAVVVVDPGPDLDGHVRALARAGQVVLVLITHRHGDHTDAIDALHELTGTPVRAALPEHCRDAQPLTDGERITAAGVELEVLATPGHTSDSLSFRLLGDETLDTGGFGAGVQPIAAILTGDTVLGRGTTMLDHPDGTLTDYLASLDRLEAAAAGSPGLPAHGEPLPDLAATCRQLRQHRHERLDEVRAALESLGMSAHDASAEQLAERIYPEVPEQVRPAARRSIEAQLAHLQQA